jgi:hypothetical protein
VASERIEALEPVRRGYWRRSDGGGSKGSSGRRVATWAPEVTGTNGHERTSTGALDGHERSQTGTNGHEVRLPGPIPKLNVAGSSPVSRSTFSRQMGCTGRVDGGKWPFRRGGEARGVAHL